MKKFDEFLTHFERPYLHLKHIRDGVIVNGDSIYSIGKKIIRGETSGPADGIFLDWIWDGKTLEVMNDRYGMYPLCYASYGNEIVISTSLTKILDSSISKELNYSALSIYFRIGYMVGNDTPFKNIHLLPPNTNLSWSEGNLKVNSKEVHGCFENNTVISYENAIDGYIHYFKNAITRRLARSSDIVLPISGGRDSRNILFELVRQDCIPSACVTIKYRPPATNEDERIASLLCQRFGINHKVLEKPDSWFDVVLKDLYLTNFCGGGHSWALPLAEYLTSMSVSTIYDGIAGDILSSGHTLDDTKDKLFKKNNLEELALILLNEADYENFNKRALTKEFYNKISMENAVERLVRELKKHVVKGNPALSYIFWNRTRRAVATLPFSILSGIKTVHCPYLDHEFLDFCTALDTSIILSGNFHDDVIKKAYPEYADIPYENKNLRADYDKDARKYYSDSVRDFSKYLLKKYLKNSKIIKTKYIYSKVIGNLLRNCNEQPWYLRRALYVYELENICEQG